MAKRRRKTVVVQVEAWLPRPHLRDKTRMTKKTFMTRVNLGRWPVLYFDNEVIVVKQFGSVCLYQPSDGRMSLAGYHRDHPKAHLVPEKHGWWWVHPDSLKELKGRRRR